MENVLFEYYIDSCEYECQFTQRKLDEKLKIHFFAEILRKKPA
jgi:hypothetical protein